MPDDCKNAYQMMPWRNTIEGLIYADRPNVVRLATMLRADGVLQLGDFFRLFVDHMKIPAVLREFAISEVVGL